jgi:hypothetical protein
MRPKEKIILLQWLFFGNRDNNKHLVGKTLFDGFKNIEHEKIQISWFFETFKHDLYRNEKKSSYKTLPGDLHGLFGFKIMWV